MERQGNVMIFIVSLIICLSYLFFFLWISGSLFIDSDEQQVDRDYLFVSIIVAIRNEEANIIDLLDCLVSQNYPTELYEIIIVNDRSTDNSTEIIKPYLSRFPNISLITIHQTELGWGSKKWALNSGINQAIGTVVIQTDADCRPPSTWVKSMASKFDDDGISFVFGPSPLHSSIPLLSHFFEFESLSQDSISAASSSRGLVMSCTGRNMGFRKSTFVKINGYDGIEHFVSGDDDLLIQKFASKSKAGIIFNYDSSALVKSSAPSTLNEFINQRIRFASKGIDYYLIDTTLAFRLILPLILLTNISVLFSFYNIVAFSSVKWSIIFYCKLLADMVLTFTFFKKISYSWNILAFLFLSFIHPLYITLFAMSAPFIEFKWKQ